MARILAVSDAFDAMTSTRAYRKALSLEEAMYILRNDASATWDTSIVKVLFDCIREGVIAPGQVATSRDMNRHAISELLTRVDTFPVSESFSPIGAGGGS
jgi:HD-GYP domain-containing protein (c-di-GMP phosphodiesterase class II)